MYHPVPSEIVKFLLRNPPLVLWGFPCMWYVIFSFVTFKIFFLSLTADNLTLLNLSVILSGFNLFMFLGESVGNTLGQIGLAIWVCFWVRPLPNSETRGCASGWEQLGRTLRLLPDHGTGMGFAVTWILQSGFLVRLDRVVLHLTPHRAKN